MPPTALTFAVVHKYENLPYIPRSHSCDTGVQITNNVLVTDKVFLQERKHKFNSINKSLCLRFAPKHAATGRCCNVFVYYVAVGEVTG